MNALRVHDAVFGVVLPLRIQLIDEGSGCIDDGLRGELQWSVRLQIEQFNIPVSSVLFGRGELDVVRCRPASFDRLANEVEDEPTVVVTQVRVVVLDAASNIVDLDDRLLLFDLLWTKELWTVRLKVADCPIRRATERCKPWWERGGLVHRSEETQFGDIRRVRLQ